MQDSRAMAVGYLFLSFHHSVCSGIRSLGGTSKDNLSPFIYRAHPYSTCSQTCKYLWAGGSISPLNGIFWKEWISSCY